MLDIDILELLSAQEADDVKVTRLIASLRGLHGSAVVQAAFARPEATKI